VLKQLILDVIMLGLDAQVQMYTISEKDLFFFSLIFQSVNDVLCVK